MVRIISDQAGNMLPGTVAWDFYTFNQPDQDQDGLPDDIEIELGLDPANPDSRGDGLRDGQRDLDNDGLLSGWEVFWLLDPTNPNSVDPNILDGDLDPLLEAYLRWKAEE